MFYGTGVNLVTALIILVLGLILGRILVNVVRNLYKDSGLDQIFGKWIVKYLSVLIQFVVYVLTLFFALKQLGLTVDLFKQVLIVLIGGVLLLVFLSFKDNIPNFTAYFYVRRKFSKGSSLEYQGLKGKVVSVRYFETVLNVSGEKLFVPNSRLVLK